MPVVGMVGRGDHIIWRAWFYVGKYLHAIAGGSSNAVGKPALEIQQDAARLKQEEYGQQ